MNQIELRDDSDDKKTKISDSNGQSKLDIKRIFSTNKKAQKPPSKLIGF